MTQALPPSVKEILTAYAAKGTDGDKQVLLAILQAKAAEDQVRQFFSLSLLGHVSLSHIMNNL